MANPQKFRGGGGGPQNEKTLMMDQRDNMVRGLVGTDGALNVVKAKAMLDVIGNNLFFIPNLSGSNVSLIYSQRPQMRWPIFAKAARESGLQVRAERKGRGANILVPVTDAQEAEQKRRAGRSQVEVTREAATTSANLVQEVASELRMAGEALADEKQRIAEQLRQSIQAMMKGPKTPEAAGKIALLKTNLAETSKLSEESFASSEQLGTDASRLRETAADETATPERLAMVASEVGAALNRLAEDNEASVAAHEALGETMRTARNEYKRVEGRPTSFKPVPCVYDLERDFVKNEAWDRSMTTRLDPIVNPTENADTVEACLKVRGETVAPGTTASRLTSLSYSLVKSVAKETEASKASIVFATYFVARALGAENVKMPGITLQPGMSRDGKQMDVVTPGRTVAVLSDAILLSRQVLTEIIRTRDEQQMQTVSEATALAQANALNVNAGIAANVDDEEATEEAAALAPAGEVRSAPAIRGARR